MVHTISNAEMSEFQGDTEEERLQGEAQAIDRWNLAVRERNMRGLLVRFFEIAEPGYALKMNLNYLDKICENLTADGFKIAAPIRAWRRWRPLVAARAYRVGHCRRGLFAPAAPEA